jgi:integrase
MGQVFQRTYRAPDGSVRTCKTWTIRYYRDGRPHQEPTDYIRKTDAEKLLKMREGDVARGVPVSASMGRVRFATLVADVVTDYRVNGKRSVDDVERRIRLHLTPAFGTCKVSQITTSEILAFTLRRQEAGASNAEINRELAIVKRAFRLALKAGKLLHAPYVPMLAEDNVRTGFFERAEFESVRKYLPDALRGVVTLAYLTGWRVKSEILPLQWSQIDRDAKVITLHPGTTKNRQGRSLSYGLNADLCTLIDAQWAAHEVLAKRNTLCPWVFARNGRRIRNFRKAWQQACIDAGVPGRLLHDFRRTAVRNLVRTGTADSAAMKVTGHRTRSVFDRYNIVTDTDVRDAMGRLGTVTETVTAPQPGRVRPFRQKRKTA